MKKSEVLKKLEKNKKEADAVDKRAGKGSIIGISAGAMVFALGYTADLVASIDSLE